MIETRDDLIIILLCLFFVWIIIYIYVFHSRTYDTEILTTKQNIAIVTLETRNLAHNNLHNKSIREYADLCGYDYFFETTYSNKLDLPIYWKKLQIVRDLLDHSNNYDYILWLDSDTIITRNDRPLELIIEKSGYKDILMAKDYPSTILNVYCAGVFFIKNSPIGKQFLDDCITTYINRPACYNTEDKLDTLGMWAGQCYEQGVMNELIYNRYHDYSYTIPPNYVMNSGFLSTDPIISHNYGNKAIIYRNFKQFEDNRNILPLSLKSNNNNNNKISLILTMYMTENRRSLYETVIYKWLNNSDYILYIVNSSGAELNIKNDRIRFFNFKQSVEMQNNPSLLEAQSLIKIFDYYAEDLLKSDLIFKCTCKYYIPHFKELINNIPQNIDFCIQYMTHTHGQNCEYFGIKASLFRNFFASFGSTDIMEKKLLDASLDKKYTTIRFPLIQLEHPVIRSDGSSISFL